jgi:hypothetical protein
MPTANATERYAHTVSAPDNPITVGDVLRWHGPVGHLLTAAHRRTAGPWNPLWRSPAAIEAAITSRLRRPDGTTWGDAPLGSAYTAAGLLTAATVEHADATHRLLASSPISSLALDTMTAPHWKQLHRRGGCWTPPSTAGPALPACLRCVAPARSHWRTPQSN